MTDETQVAEPATNSTPTETAATEAAEPATTSTEASSADEGEATFLASAGESAAASSEDAGGEEAETPDEGSEGIPEQYALSLKDEEGNDVALDAEMVEQASEVFRELGLNNDQANALVPLGQEMLRRGSESAIQSVIEAGAQQSKAWLEELRADPEIGGANLKQTESLAAKAMDALGFTEGHEFREMLNTSGLGNNIHMAKILRTLGHFASEENTFARPDGASETKRAGWLDLYDKSPE